MQLTVVSLTIFVFSFHSLKIGHFSSKTVPITFITPEGEEREVQAELGMNLLDVAQANDVYLEGETIKNGLPEQTRIQFT